MKLKCGCEIIQDECRPPYLKFCPLHEAAEATLDWLVWLHDNLITMDNYPSDVTIRNRSLNDILAIAKAKDEKNAPHQT
jgi:hypothetical protein